MIINVIKGLSPPLGLVVVSGGVGVDFVEESVNINIWVVEESCDGVESSDGVESGDGVGSGEVVESGDGVVSTDTVVLNGGVTVSPPAPPVGILEEAVVVEGLIGGGQTTEAIKIAKFNANKYFIFKFLIVIWKVFWFYFLQNEVIEKNRYLNKFCFAYFFKNLFDLFFFEEKKGFQR
jgi:hypothetical protein